MIETLIDYAKDLGGVSKPHWLDIPAPPSNPDISLELAHDELLRKKRTRECLDYVYEYAPDGSYMALKSEGMPARGGGKRDAVRGFSRGSRRRLFQKLAKLRHDKGSLPLFVTLTYPDEFPTDKAVYKMHLQLFAQRLLYSFPEASFIWKLEYQKRGAAHYHLLVFGISAGHAMELIPSAWSEVVGSDDPAHLAWHMGALGNEHCVQPVKNWRGVMAYAGKYIGKVDTGQHFPTGRIWGTRGKLPVSHMKGLKLDYQQALEFKRVFEKISGRRKTGEAAYQIGFWTFGDGEKYAGYCERISSTINSPPFRYVSSLLDWLYPPEQECTFF